MRQFAVLGGRTIADGLRTIIGVLHVVVVGSLLGFGFASIDGATGTIAPSGGIGYACSRMDAATAVQVKRADMVCMLSVFRRFPLMLASTVFTPTEQMPGRLGGLAERQPISVVRNVARCLGNGVPARDAVLGRQRTSAAGSRPRAFASAAHLDTPTGDHTLKSTDRRRPHEVSNAR